jgi:hypothetical protein
VSNPALADGLYRFCMDLVTIIALGAMFLRRHARPDLFAVYVAFNIGLFAVLTFLSSHSLSAGVGFGVFGVLSIIRLRSEAYANIEIAYFFLALAAALVNALPGRPLALSVALDAAIFLTLYFVDSPVLSDAATTSQVVLDRVLADSTALVLDLERRMATEVLSTKVLEVDYVRETTRVEVRHRPREAPVNVRPDRSPELPATQRVHLR